MTAQHNAALYQDVLTALACASLGPPDDLRHNLSIIAEAELTDHDVIELQNFVSSYGFALAKDTPAKRWWDAAENNRAPVYRALRIDPQEYGAAYAALPFRYLMDGGQHRIAVAYPCPHYFAPTDADHLCIEDVLLWNPVDDTVEFMGQSDHRLVGNLGDPARNTLSPSAPCLYAQPRMFFQHWAMARAQWAGSRHRAAGNRWHVDLSEGDEAPGSLIVGDLAKVRLTSINLPDSFDCAGVDPQTVNRAILRSARLPRATNSMKVAA